MYSELSGIVVVRKGFGGVFAAKFLLCSFTLLLSIVIVVFIFILHSP
jgi:hypothetical protein